jgi:hypothetical protein
MYEENTMTKRNANLGAALAGDDDEDIPLLKPRSAAAKGKSKKAATAPVVETVETERMVCIVLEENDNIPPTGQFISVNGRAWMLRPGEPARVPESLVRVLNDAVEHMPQQDQTTRQVVGYRKRLRFPYRLVDESELAAA